MEYVAYDFFNKMYPNAMSPVDFANYEWEARRLLDTHTTGIDNVKKLRCFFPEDEDNAEAVKRCMCKLIKLMHDVETAEQSRGLVQRGDGSVMTGLISSVSSGTESISYATSGGTAFDAAVSNADARNKMYSQIVKSGLSGVTDANGVNLLFMGRYPRVR